MTLEELKAEAKKHGYKLVELKPYIRMLPCVCGHNKIGLSYIFPTKSPTPYYHKCSKCGFASIPCKTKYEAKLKWNECVENARKEREL